MEIKKPFSFLINKVKELKIFKRNKKPVETKVVSALIYQTGLSYRGTSKIVSITNKTSHVSVRDWFRKLRIILPEVKRKFREIIAIDETKLKINGKQIFVFAAIDIKKRRF